MGTKLKALLEEYGPIALWTYFIIFFLTMAGFAVAINYGWQAKGTGESAGLLMGAWLATKLTQPLRIAGTFALTPIVATALKRLRRKPNTETDSPTPPAP